jgi:hypothetical protein
VLDLSIAKQPHLVLLAQHVSSRDDDVVKGDVGGSAAASVELESRGEVRTQQQWSLLARSDRVREKAVD